MNKKYVAMGLVVLTAFAAGRFSTPTKTKIVTQTVEVEKKTDEVKAQTDLAKHKQTVQVEVKKPDGTVTTTTTTVEDDQAKHTSDNKSADNLAETTTRTKEVTRGSAPVTIAALVGAKLSFSSQALSYGGSVYKPVLGPIGIGIWGLSSGTGGLSVGLSF